MGKEYSQLETNPIEDFDDEEFEEEMRIRKINNTPKHRFNKALFESKENNHLKSTNLLIVSTAQQKTGRVE